MSANARLSELESCLARLSKAMAKWRRDVKGGAARARRGDTADAATEHLLQYLALSPTLDKDSLLQSLLRCAIHVVRAGGAGLTLLDSRKQRLVFRAALGDGAEGIVGQEVPLRGSQHGLAFATGEVQSAAPIYTSIEKAARAKFRNVLVAPLLVEDEGVGTISAVNKQGADHFDAKDMAAFKLFADLAALVVRQRCREDFLRQGLARPRSSQRRWPGQLSADDRELLQLFDVLAQLKRSHPNLLPAVRQLAESLLG